MYDFLSSSLENLIKILPNELTLANYHTWIVLYLPVAYILLSDVYLIKTKQKKKEENIKKLTKLLWPITTAYPPLSEIDLILRTQIKKYIWLANTHSLSTTELGLINLKNKVKTISISNNWVSIEPETTAGC